MYYLKHFQHILIFFFLIYKDGWFQDYNKPKCVKNVPRGGKKQSDQNIIKSIRNLFQLHKKNEKIE